MAKLILLACLVGTVNAIYPPDHWTYSTKLSSDNVDDFVKSNVDAGKTVSQHSCHKKQSTNEIFAFQRTKKIK